MSRADACVPFLHGHTRRCNQAGYTNGRADALEEVGALADWLDSERDSIREAYRQHNAGRAEGRPVKRPDLDTWANAYEVAGRKVREALNG